MLGSAAPTPDLRHQARQEIRAVVSFSFLLHHPPSLGIYLSFRATETFSAVVGQTAKVCSVDHSCLLDKGPVLTLSHLACYPSSSSSCICTRQTAPRARVPTTTTTTTNCSPVPSFRLRIAIYSSFCSVGKQSRQQVLHCLRHRRANEPPFFSRRTSENRTTAWLDRHAVAVILAFSQSTTSSLLRWRYSQL